MMAQPQQGSGPRADTRFSWFFRAVAGAFVQKLDHCVQVLDAQPDEPQPDEPQPDEPEVNVEPDEPEPVDPACASLARLVARDGTIEFLDDGNAKISVWFENTSDEDVFDYPGCLRTNASRT